MEENAKLKEDNKLLSEQVEELEDTLRLVAYHVGVGGYNSAKVDPEVYKDKIIKGINDLCSLAESMGRRTERVKSENDK